MARYEAALLRADGEGWEEVRAAGSGGDLGEARRAFRAIDLKEEWLAWATSYDPDTPGTFAKELREISDDGANRVLARSEHGVLDELRRLRLDRLLNRAEAALRALEDVGDLLAPMAFDLADLRDPGRAWEALERSVDGASDLIGRLEREAQQERPREEEDGEEEA